MSLSGKYGVLTLFVLISWDFLPWNLRQMKQYGSFRKLHHTKSSWTTCLDCLIHRLKIIAGLFLTKLNYVEKPPPKAVQSSMFYFATETDWESHWWLSGICYWVIIQCFQSCVHIIWKTNANKSKGLFAEFYWTKNGSKKWGWTGTKMYTQEIFGFNMRIIANCRSLTLTY